MGGGFPQHSSLGREGSHIRRGKLFRGEKSQCPCIKANMSKKSLYHNWSTRTLVLLMYYTLYLGKLTLGSSMHIKIHKSTNLKNIASLRLLADYV